MKFLSTLSAFIFIVVLSVAGLAQDPYQLLRSDPAGYAAVEPGKGLSFPIDHLPHKAFKIEWWYLTANLKDESGEDYGVHWTLFRQAMSPEPDPGDWQSNQVWMAHTALSLPDEFVYEQRFARGGIGQADVRWDMKGRFSAWLDDWHWQAESQEPFPSSLSLTSKDVAIELRMEANTPWVLQGKNGYSQKSELGQASYYYSQPHINIKATILADGVETPLSGLGWLDREWSSQPLAPDQPGWDWLSLHLDDGLLQADEHGGQWTINSCMFYFPPTQASIDLLNNPNNASGTPQPSAPWVLQAIGEYDHTARDWGTLVPEVQMFTKDLVPRLTVDLSARVAPPRRR